MRQCGKCGYCCKLLSVPVLGKPGGVWCEHWCHGCTIYDKRPNVCRTFACQWLIDEELGDVWYPPRAKMFAYFDHSVTPNLLRVLVDEGYFGRWRAEPYNEKLRQLSGAGLRDRKFHTVVQCGHRHWVITPYGETEVTDKRYFIDGWKVIIDEEAQRGDIARR